MDHARIRDIYRQVDALDAAGFAAAFGPAGTVVFGNQPPSRGREPIESALAAFFSLLDGMQHSFTALWDVPEGHVLEAEVAYRVKGVGQPVVVSGVTILRTAGDLLRDVRIYYDLAPVFAAAQAARESEPPAVVAPAITHLTEGEHRGAFVITKGRDRIAEMTYSRAGTKLVIIDHTWVSDELRGQGVARRLLDAFVAWAREAKVQVIPLCPYARSAFDGDASIRDVLAP